MSEKVRMFFVDPPSMEELELFLEKIQDERRAGKKSSRSSLVPYVQTVQMCAAKGMALRNIADFLFAQHGVKFHHSTISDFLKRFPGLRAHGGNFS